MEWNSSRLKALFFYVNMSANAFYRKHKAEIKVSKSYLYKLIVGTAKPTKALSMRFTKICVDVLGFTEADFDQVISISETQFKK